MIRHFAITCAALGALTGAASAQSAFPFWAGMAVVDTVTAACNTGGFVRAKDLIVSSYRAKTGVSGEPGNPGIMFQSVLTEMAYFRKNGSNANTMAGNGQCAGYVIRGNVTTVPNPTTPEPFACSTSNFVVNPATVTATTETISVDGMIRNWRGVAGCNVTFRAAYRLNPP